MTCYGHVFTSSSLVRTLRVKNIFYTLKYFVPSTVIYKKIKIAGAVEQNKFKNEPLKFKEN